LKDERYVKISEKIRESALPFAALASLFIFLACVLLSPLAKPLLWSIVLSYFAYPFYMYVYKKILKGRYANIAAGLTTAAILFFMFIPMLLLGLFLTKELFRIYDAIISSGLLSPPYGDIIMRFRNIPILGLLMSKFDIISGIPMLESLLNGTISWATDVAKAISKSILGNAFKTFYLLAIVTISSFFFVRDGHKILNYIKDIIPLPADARENLQGRAAKMLRAVVYGIIFTAAIQGCLGGIGWWFVGLSHPIFFGFVMFITGMIPFVGTPVVWIPGSIVLLIQNDIAGGLMLLAWGFGVVSMVDNFIRPYFISEESRIHMLVIFVGIFGGLFNWGFLGIFMGPLILSLGIFVLDVYKSIALANNISAGALDKERM
jgi:predicted PurR-regulated permease PerM